MLNTLTRGSYEVLDDGAEVAELSVCLYVCLFVRSSLHLPNK